MSQDYDLELQRFREASAAFRKAQSDYRARKIGDAAFLSAKATFDAAGKKHDTAMEREEKAVRTASRRGRTTKQATFDFGTRGGKARHAARGTVPIVETSSMDFTTRIHWAQREDGQWFRRIQVRDPRYGYKWQAWSPRAEGPTAPMHTDLHARLPRTGGKARHATAWPPGKRERLHLIAHETVELSEHAICASCKKPIPQGAPCVGVVGRGGQSGLLADYHPRCAQLAGIGRKASAGGKRRHAPAKRKAAKTKPAKRRVVKRSTRKGSGSLAALVADINRLTR